MTFIYVKFQFLPFTEKNTIFLPKKTTRKTAVVYSEKHVTFVNVTQSEMLKTFLEALLVLKFRLELKEKGTVLSAKVKVMFTL
jgi:hypothetical protein